MIGINDKGFVVVVLLYLFSVENNENVRINVKLTIEHNLYSRDYRAKPQKPQTPTK